MSQIVQIYCSIYCTVVEYCVARAISTQVKMLISFLAVCSETSPLEVSGILHHIHSIMFNSHSRPAVPPDNKKACQLYFGKDPMVGTELNLWKCTCGTVCKQDIKVGYANLMSHIRQKHPNYLEVFYVTQQEDSQSET